MSVQPKCTATPSLAAARDRRGGARRDFQSIPHAPIWPQCPSWACASRWKCQYSEGLPRAVIDEAKSRMYFPTRRATRDEGSRCFTKATWEPRNRATTPPGDQPGVQPRHPGAGGAGEGVGHKLPVRQVQVTGPLSFR